MLRLGYLTKRRDSCHWLRILNPMSYLNQRGHEVSDEVFEKLVLCGVCQSQQRRAGPYEVQYDQGAAPCPVCQSPMMSAEEFSEWNQSIHRLLEEKDIIAFQRPTDLSHIQLMRKAKAMGKKTVQVCDDHYLVPGIPEWNSGHQYYKDRQGFIAQSLREVDALEVTTPYLKELYRPYNQTIGILPNSLDVELIDVTPAMPHLAVYDRDGKQLSQEHFAERRAGKKFLLWGGSPTHLKDLEMIVGALRRLSRSESICLGLVGYVHRAFLEVIPKDSIFLFSLIPSDQYFMVYKAIQADIGLAPVVECEFNKGKSNLKALEYEILNILPVMSDFVTYEGCSPQGYYAKGDEYSWYTALRRAVHCENLSERLLENKKFVTDHYDIKKNVSLWEEFYGSL